MSDEPPPSAAAAHDRLVHELRVHQAELEAQNDELRRAQIELAASRARYLELYDLAPVGYVTLGEGGRVVQANLTVATLLGVPHGALAGQSFFGFVATEHRDAAYLLLKALEKTGLPQSCELRMVTGEGSFWAQLDATPGLDAGASVTRVVLSVITARKTLELQHEHERRVLESLTGGRPMGEVLTQLLLGFEALYPGMRGSVLLLDPDGVHLRTAAAPNLPTAYSSAIDGVAIGPEVGSCGTAAYTKRPKIAADIASDPAWRDYRGLALDHGLRACWSVPILGTSGQVLGTFAFYFDAPRDATPSEQESLERGAQLASVAIERYRAEASLRESEHRREVALFGAELGLWDWNVRTGVVVYDDRWCAMLGYRVDELAPDVASWTSLMHPDDREPVQVRLEPHLKGETPDYETEFRLRHRDGHWVWIQARGKVVERDAAGAPLRMAGTHMDIGPRKRAEAALREGDARNAKQEEQLHQAAKMQTVGRLAGGVAHDFNNMLAVILGHVEAALAGGDPEQLREDLLAIQQAGTRAADVTQQLLAFARQQTVVPRVLDLNDMVTSMLKLLGRLLGEQIEIRWQPAAGLWAIEMDPTQVDQIVTNLCVNARDAIADVGTIVITTENLVVAAEFCNDRPELSPGDYVRLSVADDGAGIDADVLAHVFEPFFTTKGVGEGTGLGLATVYGAVRQNRGHVTVASERGRGTTFEILLPRAPPALVPTLVAPPTATPRAAEIILLVEDEPALLRIVTRHLQGQGYTVLTANDPHEAVRLAREPGVRIDLLVTDVIMPKMNGRELATALLAFHPHLRCLFMSGYTADVIGGRGMLSPDVHFIQKPFSRADLVAKARAALGGKV